MNKYTCTCNNQRLRSVGDDDPRSNVFAPVQWVLCVGFSWQMVQTCVIRLRDKRLKHACSNCVLYILFILSGGPKKCWLHTCDTCIITNKRFCGLLLSPATKNICCHRIRKPNLIMSVFCSKPLSLLKMYSKRPRFQNHPTKRCKHFLPLPTPKVLPPP